MTRTAGFAKHSLGYRHRGKIELRRVCRILIVLSAGFNMLSRGNGISRDSGGCPGYHLAGEPSACIGGCSRAERYETGDHSSWDSIPSKWAGFRREPEIQSQSRGFQASLKSLLLAVFLDSYTIHRKATYRDVSRKKNIAIRSVS